MKIAQYEMLGNVQKRETRPERERDDRRVLALREPHSRDQEPIVSIVPGGTSIPFVSLASTSYWATFVRSLRDQSCRRFCPSTDPAATNRSAIDVFQSPHQKIQWREDGEP